MKNKDLAKYYLNPEAVKKCRFNADLTQQELAVMLELTQSYYNGIENGHIPIKEVHLENLIKILAGLGIKATKKKLAIKEDE